MEVVDEDREERLERVRRRTLEWKTNHLCRLIILDQMETAMVEAEWKQQMCAELVLEGVGIAVMESRMKSCKELLMETVVRDCWEVLELNRLLREAKEGGVERLNRMEEALKMEREERECIAAVIEEERCLEVRLKKKERIQKAWRLSMEAKKFVRMTRMLEELTMEDMDMELDSIEMIVHEMMEIEDWAEVDDWQEDRDGDQVMPQVEFKMMTEDMEVMEATEARGGAMSPYWWGGASVSNKYPGTWPYKPTRPK